MNELLDRSALELGDLIRQREISSEELTRFFLERIERFDGELSSFVTVLRRRAILAARLADRRLRSRGEEPIGVFHGVPTGVKDLVPMRGTPTKLGSRAFRWFVSPFDAPTARTIKRAGFVVLGKLATSELGALPITEPDIHPPTRNPWNLAHSAGGSSGGSGAAVAAGLVPIAQGSDGGGSIRIPAAFNHLFGFKPSLSLLGNMHGAVNRLGLSVVGPLAHTVEDAAAMLDVLRGHPLGDPVRGDDFCRSQCHRPPGRLRVRVTTRSPLGDETDAAIADGVRRTAELLEELGHEVETAPIVEGKLEDFLPLWQLQLALVPVPRIGDASLQPVTRWLRQTGRALDRRAVERAHAALKQEIDEQLDGADVLVTPSVASPPPRVGQFEGLAPEELFRAVAPIGAFTAPFNVTRGPAASIPGGVTGDGLPFGVQLGSHPGQDGILLALARQLEEARPWRGRRPAGYFDNGTPG
jgi:amidase